MKSYYLLNYHSDSSVRGRRVIKAKRSGSSHLLLTWQWYLSTECPSIDGMKTALLLPHSILRECENEVVEKILTAFDEIVLEFDPKSYPLSGHIERFYECRDRIQAVFRFQDEFHVQLCLSYLPIWLREKMGFSPASELTGKQIYNIGKEIARNFPEMHYRPLSGLVQWDSRISDEIELVLTGSSSLEMRSEKPDVKISVIIPCFESEDYLLNCLRHLANQNLNRNLFEILLVDDGSKRPVVEELESFLSPESGSLNLRYFHLPKNVATRGEAFGQFRAGLCRNFGAFEAQGEILSFLDSDMLVPSNYLDLVKNRLQETDLLQFVRYHIKPSFSGKFTNVQDLAPTEFYIEESSYWGPFFRSDDWMNLPDFWKYTCTYSLSLSRQMFFNLGQFRKTYVSYGFEDTDLGYTAHLAGLRFFLEKTPLFHLTPFTEKARYRHSMYHKHQLMRGAAKTFFVNHLSPAIYEKLKVFL